MPRLSIPGEKPDLCYQVNKALAEAKGELVVFLQDHIDIEPDALEKCWKKYQEHPDTCYTMPVGKRHGMAFRPCCIEIDSDRESVENHQRSVTWDWRYYRTDGKAKFDEWEIDFGMCPAKAIKEVGFDERYDSGFGFENVDTAYILEKQGWKFAVDPENRAVAFDHDANEPHPYKRNTNASLWAKRKEVIDLMYDKTISMDSGVSAP